MATIGTYPATGDAFTRADVQQDEKGTTNATWTIWAEESTARTFYYWSSDQEISGGPTLDVYPGRTVVQKQEREPESEEDKLAREKSEEEARLAHEEEKRKEEEAEHKAKVLLLELIGRVDYKKFCRAGYVDVEGNSGKIFRIKPGAMTKVFAGKDKLDVALESLCIAMRDRDLPEADEMVWKKLMIESDEKAFVEVANHFDP